MNLSKRGASALLYFSLSVCASAFASTDALTGLPLHPGFSDSMEGDPSSICNSQMKSMAYGGQRGTTMDEYVQWYKAHLPGYRNVSRSTPNGPVSYFWSADGTKAVWIVGVPDSHIVASVAYVAISPPLKPDEIDHLSTSESCK